MSAKPCQCDEPNPSCRRAGVPMTETLFNLCKGVGHTHAGCEVTEEMSLKYRRAWDAQFAGKPVADPPCVHLWKRKRVNGEVVKRVCREPG